MALFTIGDLHLSFGVDKPMDVFKGWAGYTERLSQNWKELITPEDTIVLSGDISWAMGFNELVPDFEFINNLPGKKIILKGNHDYWWNTMSKMEAFLQENDFRSISFLFNNSFKYNDIAICGTRGWVFETGEEQNTKITAREAGRLERSLASAQCDGKIVFLHYPPMYQGAVSEDIIETMHRHNVKKCFYGHLHASSISYAKEGLIGGIDYKLISADAINFCPYKIFA